MPDMTQQAMMAEALRARQAPEQEAEGEGLPPGCICDKCPRMDECMSAGGGPKTPEDAGGAMPGGMGGGMKMGGAA